MDISQEEYEDFLYHHGVRGMKWGVHRQRRIQALERAGTKGGPIISKVRQAPSILGVGGTLGPIDLIRGRGITGGARRKAIRLGAREDRIRTGKAKTMDYVKHFGTTRVTDLFPVRSKNANKKTTVKADYAIVAAAGAVIAARMLVKAGQRAAAANA